MSLYDVRQELVDVVTTAGLKVLPTGTTRLSPPVVIVDAAEPYIAKDTNTTFNTQDFTVNYDLILFERWTQNEAAFMALDSMIEKIISNLGGWTLTNVTGETVFALPDGTRYLTSTISVQNTLEMESN